MNIQDEALEVAAHAIYSVNRKKEVSERTYEERWPRHRFAYKVLARAALEAAAPYMLAEDGRRIPSDRRPSIVTDAVNRVAYFLNWHQGDNDITADFPSGPSLYASDLQVILNELKAGDPSEPREIVIRDSSGHVLDRWVDPDE